LANSEYTHTLLHRATPFIFGCAKVISELKYNSTANALVLKKRAWLNVYFLSLGS